MFARARHLAVLLAAFLAMGVLSEGAHAQYPSKAIRFIVPWPPGGAADIMARLIGEGLSKELGQTVVVDNRPGAGGLVATEQVAKMEPDGHTLLLGSTGPNAIAGSLYKNLRYDPVKDLTPVTQITELPLLLVVNKDFPANNVKELIAYAKANPGKVNFASVGSGTAQHLASEIFKITAGINIVHVPYKGSAPAFTDLAGGAVQMLFDNIPASRAMLQAGKVKAIAVSTSTRSTAMPDLPTVAESGLPGFHVSAWQNIAMPPGSPPEAVARVNREVVKFLNSPEMRKRITDMGANVVGNTPAEEAQRIKDEVEKWGRAVKAAGVSLEY
ncbi:MAG TPA: tripartite tricarboxylate transporter substrate binding protein [Usitatibacteraceae bacterium]|jgi:tripartite-type tricarboxylate transporter receptor subunit TctC|nr:tripartite tricarboxylate transporter substrate binding protein [Burkholderiales bacterium]HQZ46077.1 tripartite tricarboxylate transporter substrate binding protein [Usitatibacteraceae bacterium]